MGITIRRYLYIYECNFTNTHAIEMFLVRYISCILTYLVKALYISNLSQRFSTFYIPVQIRNVLIPHETSII